jgi:hypothetical protein
MLRLRTRMKRDFLIISFFHFSLQNRRKEQLTEQLILFFGNPFPYGLYNQWGRE